MRAGQHLYSQVQRRLEDGSGTLGLSHDSHLLPGRQHIVYSPIEKLAPPRRDQQLAGQYTT